MSFRVWWQRYPERWRAVRLDEPHPPKEFRDFETRKEAEVFRDARRRDGAVATVTPTPEPAVKETAAKRRAQLAELGFPEMRKRLTT